MVVPWLLFVATMSMFVLCFQDNPSLVMVAAASSGLLSLLMTAYAMGSSHAAIAAIGVMCLSSVGTGSSVGAWIHVGFMEEYHRIAGGIEHRETGPLTAAKDTGGAAIFRFSEGAFVDSQRTIGFVAGHDIHCVAPIVWPPRAPTSVQFWAVGRNCCEMRSNFDCGYARWDLAGQAGQAGIYYAPTDELRMAVREFQAVYGISSAANAQFIAFAGEPGVVQAKLWNEALYTCLIASFISFQACLASGLLLTMALAHKHG